MFGPIILFSIILPFIDIITDLRMIIRLAFIGIDSCIPRSGSNITSEEYEKCLYLDELSEFCKQNPNLCSIKTKWNFATILLGEKYSLSTRTNQYSIIIRMTFQSLSC